MNKLCVACAIASAFMIPAARAAVEFDDFSLHAVAGAYSSEYPAFGNADTVKDYSTLPAAPIQLGGFAWAGWTPVFPAVYATAAQVKTVAYSDLTSASGGEIALQVEGNKDDLATTDASSSGTATSLYDFTSTTPFRFDLSTVGATYVGSTTFGEFDYLERLTPGAPQLIHLGGLTGSESFDSALLPAGEYRLFAQLRDSSFDVDRGPGLYYYGVRALLDFSIQPEAVSAPVPESSSWAMLIGGLALVGGMARRRRAGEHAIGTVSSIGAARPARMGKRQRAKPRWRAR